MTLNKSSSNGSSFDPSSIIAFLLGHFMGHTGSQNGGGGMGLASMMNGQNPSSQQILAQARGGSGLAPSGNPTAVGNLTDYMQNPSWGP